MSTPTQIPMNTYEWVLENAISDISIAQEKNKRIKNKKRVGELGVLAFSIFSGLFYAKELVWNVQRNTPEFNTSGIAILLSLLISLISFLFYFAYTEIIKEFDSIAGKKECAELMYWASIDQEIAERVALIQQQNRQAYQFDYVNARYHMAHYHVDYSQEEIEEACKRLHAVN